MTQNASFLRKIIYGCIIVMLLFPLFLLGQPATSPSGAAGEESRGSAGGVLAQMRSSYGLSQAELGKIDPASETMKMATLGLRGVATNLLWTKADAYKKTESWDKLSATLNQIAKLQPNYITVWEYQAHNLSYNVSVEFDDYRSRYHWVKKGLEFLLEGTNFNQRSPRLFWNLGWFTGHKIGRSDEREQFRRLFRQDTDFHNTLEQHINMINSRGPDGNPDNWLTAYLWYLKSVAVAEDVPVTWLRLDVNKEGYTDKRRSPLLFYSDPSMALIAHADAITKEFTPGERTREAWREAGRKWEEFGLMELPTTWGRTLRLKGLEQARLELQQLRDKLDALSPGLRDQLLEERRASLTPEEQAAIESVPSKDPAQITQEEGAAYRSGMTKLQLADIDVAEAMPEAVREQARLLAQRCLDAGFNIDRIVSYRTIVNYPYWETRCEVESSQTTSEARRFMRLADQAGEKGDPEGAKTQYESAWDEWAKIFEKYPRLVDDEMAEDLQEAIVRYKLVLDQLDEEFPADFKLQMLLDKQAEAERLEQAQQQQEQQQQQQHEEQQKQEQPPEQPPAGTEGAPTEGAPAAGNAPSAADPAAG
jgi:hypothetical protein